jgi:hypothetical protein
MKENNEGIQIKLMHLLSLLWPCLVFQSLVFLLHDLSQSLTSRAAGRETALCFGNKCTILQKLFNIIRIIHLISIPDIGIGRVTYWVHTALSMPQASISEISDA